MTRSRVWPPAAALPLAAGLLAFFFWPTRYEPVAPSFEGDSGRLRRTAFVPTLDTPIPEGKSAVWCASFQLAWDKLKEDVVKGPVEVTGAAAFCDRLNKAAPAADDLPPEGFYAAGGFKADGIGDTIRAEMARKFPNAPRPELPSGGPGVVAYAYLEADVHYERPYPVNPRQFLFHELGGSSRGVGSFGIPVPSSPDVAKEVRDQTGALFGEYGEPHGRSMTNYAVDLSRRSRPSQVVVARVDRKRTLAETLADVERQIRVFAPPSDAGWKPTLQYHDTLLVPYMRWKVRHQFSELLGPGKALKLNGHSEPMLAAEQTIAFRLDAQGAGVASSARLETKSAGYPRHFSFDRPFLLYLKKRDAEHPFFVMWVENAELLCGR